MVASGTSMESACSGRRGRQLLGCELGWGRQDLPPVAISASRTSLPKDCCGGARDEGERTSGREGAKLNPTTQGHGPHSGKCITTHAVTAIGVEGAKRFDGPAIVFGRHPSGRPLVASRGRSQSHKPGAMRGCCMLRWIAGRSGASGAPAVGSLSTSGSFDTSAGSAVMEEAEVPASW